MAESEAPRAAALDIALGISPADARPALETLFALDVRFGSLVARATEPTIGLMRLVWWRDALEALDRAPPPAEPLLQACAALAARGVSGAALAALTTGWEVLLDDPALSDESLASHGTARGSALFALAGQLLGAQDPRLAGAGAGWALADLARHSRDPDRAARAWDAAARALARTGGRWPARLRPLGLLAAAARHATTHKEAGPRAAMARLLAFQLFGR
ncbi:squalene/phytoene synthase family protein [Sphingomonas morindae]|uniref:Phytoene synthase n=1 Tax=Sphingomonas morindae TaxID=1541170 RepID=A0ABY4X8L9_9SPHN|nr:squalene/phytoene synthase family protein [Sphingomonas morindae]USI73026.1 hypothetical protein LHA26_00675 [Sphingomonas morindae]